MPVDPRLNQTLGSGRYVLAERLCGEGPRRLYLAYAASQPEERFLASLAPMDDLDIARFRRTVDYQIAGVMELGFVGHLDVRGNDFEENALQERTWVMLEKLSEGAWLPRLLHRRWGFVASLSLAISVGEIAQQATINGAQMGHIRPEYVCAKEQAGALVATSLSGRYEAFFHHQHRHSSRILFKRGYYAPEPQFEASSLTFTLATMLAEWLTGEFPFPDSWLGSPSRDYLAGRATLNGVPTALEQVLHRGFIVDPAQRPTLPQFLDELAGLIP